MNKHHESKLSNTRLGVALSGGGYRAAAFHLGTLRKLSKMGILEKVDVLSTISGGSIIGAYYALNKGNFQSFEKDFSSLLKQSVIKQVLTSSTFFRILAVVFCMLFLTIYFLLFTHFPWISFLILILGVYFAIRYQFSIFPVSRIVEKTYDKIFYKKHTLDQLNERPVIAINATNLSTSRLFTFSKHKMGDSTYTNEEIQFTPMQFPVSRAVMASTCIPFAFTPVAISPKYIIAKKDSLVDPLLIDGGVYDNQGIHKLAHQSNPPYINDYECDVIITSDAGNKLAFGFSYHNVLTLLSRTSDLFMNRIKMLQIMQNLYQNVTGAKKEIAYISLGWDLEKCIPGFVTNLRAGKILVSVKVAHGLTEDFINDHNDEELRNYMENRVNFKEIIRQGLSLTDLKAARSVTTNLTSLTEEQIRVLSLHAEIQTELQVSLYCPSLITNKTHIQI